MSFQLIPEDQQAMGNQSELILQQLHDQEQTLHQDAAEEHLQIRGCSERLQRLGEQ